VVNIDRNLPKLSSWAHTIVTVRQWVPNVLSSCRNVGLTLAARTLFQGLEHFR